MIEDSPQQNTGSNTNPNASSSVKGEEEFRIVPDSSWLVAFLDSNDSHHISAESAYGAIKPYKPVFYIPTLTYMETLSRLVRVNNMPVKKAYDKIQKFLSTIHFKTNPNFNFAEVVQKYKKFSRLEIKKLRPNDFSIVADGIMLDAKILTCDLAMWHRVKKYYSKIYFVTDKVEQKKSDLGRLIEDVQHKK